MEMKKTDVILVLLASLFGLTACKNKNKEGAVDDTEQTIPLTIEENLYRPNFHFTPISGWMNDPNGMFYLNGYYHLYFQHYPDGNKWGPMHWGHAKSKDLIHWEEMPIALFPDEMGYIFSGSAIVDHENKSGFGVEGQPPIIAFFTYHNTEMQNQGRVDFQSQAIAYSLDEGNTWTKYDENPVVKNPGIHDFRDPKVVWDKKGKQYIMSLAAGQEIRFYGSKNLKDWKFLSEFGKGVGNHDGVWECPDLFPIKVQGLDEEKYVLLVSINPGGYNGGSGTQYFVGDFEEGRFVLEPSLQEKMSNYHDYWVDFGKDNYAGVTWSNIETEEKEKLFIGWMSNWQYANEVPTEKWRSAMTIPRELQLIANDSGYRLSFVPTKTLDEGKSEKIKTYGRMDISEPKELLESESIPLSSASLTFTLMNAKSSSVAVKLKNDVKEELVFGFDHGSQTFFVDRTHSGKTDFSKDFAPKPSIAPRIIGSESLQVTALLDKTSIELFFDNGTTVMTEIFFPEQPFTELWFTSSGENAQLDNIKLSELKNN
ncbi:glycoside hydrolase family 32 protein [Flagellimonas hadalis]|uniref:Glycoside hydrolase family 32 protein n=2 Tax=Flagellimonas TaxID=444459 RepID=A0A5N5ISB0_9FLAO|nr:glycoside hydrolase family 32 protein [Allomuricauda hadalis]KAB5486115.1 glycoside hydrolase family 32 protein [Allomuricauda hadalis]